MLGWWEGGRVYLKTVDAKPSGKAGGLQIRGAGRK
jgi:hypothetical protein